MQRLMDRIRLIKKAISSSIQYGKDEQYSLPYWIIETWQLSLFCLAFLLGIKVSWDDGSTGPFLTSEDWKTEFFGHKWLPVYSKVDDVS